MKVGPYEVGEQLGSGAMGQVFRVRHEELGAEFALKVIRVDLTPDPDLVQRFVREVELLARVSGKPGVVSVHTAGQHGASLYYVMDLVRGDDLQGLLRLGPVAPARAARIVRGVAEGVAHLHAAGILHRDLKPANVLLDEQERPWLVDFGLSKALLDDQNRLTHTGELLGTPAYMAPEQVDGSGLSPKTDVYALGAVLFALLGGRPPFDGSDLVTVMAQVLDGVPPLAQVAPGVPAPLADLVARATAADPAARPTAAAFADELAAFLEAAEANDDGDEAPAPSSRGPLLVGGLALLLCVGAVLATRGSDDPAEPPPPRASAASPPPVARATPAPTTSTTRAALPLADALRRARAALTEAKDAPAPEVARRSARACALLRGLNDAEAVRLRDRAEAQAKAALRQLARGGLIQTLKVGTQGDLIALAASRDGRWLATGSSSGRVTLLELPGLAVRATATRKGPGKARVLAFGGRNQLVHSRGRRLLMRRPPRWAKRAVWRATEVIRSLAVAPSGHLAVFADDDGKAWLLGLKGHGAVVKAWAPHQKKMNAAAFSPDGAWLATGSSDKTVRLWAIPFAPGPRLPQPDKVRQVVWTANDRLVVLCADRRPRRWRRLKADWQPGPALEGPRLDTNAAARSADGRLLAAVADDGWIVLWDLREGRHLKTFRAHGQDDVEAVAFAPDGTLLTGSEDATLQRWCVPQPPPPLRDLAEDPVGAVERALRALGF